MPRVARAMLEAAAVRTRVAVGALLVFLGACGGATEALGPRDGDAGATDAATSDARADGCTGTPPILQCGSGCAGAGTSPEQAVCEGPLGWTCPPPSAGCGFASFRCGPEDAGVYCATERQYCAIDRFSPPTCQELPPGCDSCGCVDAGTPPICLCTDDGGVTVTCTPP